MCISLCPLMSQLDELSCYPDSVNNSLLFMWQLQLATYIAQMHALEGFVGPYFGHYSMLLWNLIYPNLLFLVHIFNDC